ELQVLRGDFDQFRGELTGLLQDLLGRPVHGRSAELQGTGAHGADPVGDPVGVPVHHFDLVDVDAEPVGDQHGVGGPVALPVRGTAGQHQHAAVRPDLDVPGFPVGRVGRGDFDVAGPPDAELP